jgi:hypothetical protein
LSVSPQQRTIDVIVIAMVPAIHRFIEAPDRYLALDDARSGFGSPRERELFHIEIMKAYPELHIARKLSPDCNTPMEWISRTAIKQL